MLHPRELQILNTMAKLNKPVIAQDIAIESKISQSTVQAVLRKMLKDGYIENVGVIHSNNVFSRQFSITEKAQTEVINQMVELIYGIQNIVPIDKICDALKEKN